MLFLAATTGLEKIKAVPPAFWWKLGAVVGCLIVLVIILRQVAQMNKMVLAIVVLVIFTVVGVNWIYERNEPAFLTPVIDKIAPFLPSKGSYNAKQTQAPAGFKNPLPPPPEKK